MLRTRAGYCGGEKSEPTYRSMGDHTEAFSIDFDPTMISYSDLLDLFWNGHRATSNHGSRQYMNAIFYRNDDQLALAESTREATAERLEIAPEKIATHLLPVGDFTYAEGYHQKYYLTQRPEIRDFLTETYPDGKQLADSTVATLLNAYLGNGMQKNWPAFAEALPTFGLPEDLEKRIRQAVVD